MTRDFARAATLMIKKADDNSTVMWSAPEGRIAAAAGVLRTMLRAAHPEWSDDEIERWIWEHLAVQGIA